jgi:hypothetical protein
MHENTVKRKYLGPNPVTTVDNLEYFITGKEMQGIPKTVTDLKA